MKHFVSKLNYESHLLAFVLIRKRVNIIYSAYQVFMWDSLQDQFCISCNQSRGIIFLVDDRLKVFYNMRLTLIECHAEYKGLRSDLGHRLSFLK